MAKNSGSPSGNGRRGCASAANDVVRHSLIESEYGTVDRTASDSNPKLLDDGCRSWAFPESSRKKRELFPTANVDKISRKTTRSSSSSMAKNSGSPSGNGRRGCASAANDVVRHSLIESEYGTVDRTASDSNPKLLDDGCRSWAFPESSRKKRELFPTANVDKISRKTTRSSTLKCDCQRSLYPCALCTGRSDPTGSRDLPVTMTLPENTEVFDASFNQNLSLSEDFSCFTPLEVVPNEPNKKYDLRTATKSAMKRTLAMQRASEKIDFSMQSAPTTSGKVHSNNIAMNPVKRKYTKKIRQDEEGDNSRNTTASSVTASGKKNKKHQSSHCKKKPPLQSITAAIFRAYKRNAVLWNCRWPHSSSITKNSENKNRKSETAGAATATATLSNSGGQTLNNIHSVQNEYHHNNKFNSINSESMDEGTLNFLVRPMGSSSMTSQIHNMQLEHDRWDVEDYEDIIERELSTGKVNAEKLNNVSTTKKMETATSNSTPASPKNNYQYNKENDVKNTSDEIMTEPAPLKSVYNEYLPPPELFSPFDNILEYSNDSTMFPENIASPCVSFLHSNSREEILPYEPLEFPVPNDFFNSIPD